MPAKESDSRLPRQHFSPETAQSSQYTAPPRIRDCERFRGIEAARAEAISARAVEIGALNYRSVASILLNNLDKAAAARGRVEATLFDHPNVRGPRYFN